MHQIEVKKKPLLHRRDDLNAMNYIKDVKHRTLSTNVQNTSNAPAYQFHLYTLEASLFLHFSHIYTGRKREREEKTNTFGNNILRPKEKSHKSYEHTIYDTQGTHTLFARSSAHHHIFWPTTERTKKNFVSSNKKSQNSESNCLYRTTKTTITVSMKCAWMESNGKGKHVWGSFVRMWENQRGKENTAMSHQVIINHFAWKKIQILHCRVENKEYMHTHMDESAWTA